MTADSRISSEPFPAPQEEPTLLHLAGVLLRRRRIIIVMVVLFTGLFGLMAFTTPRTWTARVVLVPSSSGGDSRLQALAGQLAIPGLSALAGVRGGNSGQTVAAIVNSKAVRDSVGERARQAGHTALSRRQMQKLLKSGAEVDNDLVNRSIAVEVTTRDPRLSQRLAAGFPDAVNAIATSIAIEAAAHKRSTVERQIEVARQNLQTSQRALLDYQERTGTPQIQEQARQTVAAMGELQRAITQQELEVARLARVATPDNPAYRSAVAQLGTLRGQLRRLTTEGSEVLLAKGDLPAMQIELARRLRDYTKDEQMYTALTAEMLDTQLDLADQVEVVSVLDAPELPVEPSGPRRALLLVLGAMMGGMLGLCLAFASEYVSAARRARPHEPFFQEWDRMRAALPGGRRTRNGRAAERPDLVAP